MKLFAQIRKVDEAKRLVYARVVQETPDKVDEIFDYAASKPYFEAWSKEQHEASQGKSYGNVRAMHGKIAAGIVAEPLSFVDADKAIDAAIKVTDDQEFSKCLDGTYTGVSIGGSYVGERKTEKINGKDVKRYTAKPAEISLVDSPCIPTARFFEVVKADGALEKRAFKPPEFEVVGTDEQVAELAKSMQDKKLTMADVLGLVSKWTGDKADEKQDEGDGDEEADKAENVDHDKSISDHADAKTAAAMESNKADDHKEAAHAHRAAEAHFDGKDEAASDHHGEMAAYHEHMASHKWLEAAGVLKGLGKREFSQEQRDKAADSGAALPDGSFPIQNKSDLSNAIHAYGRAKDKEKAKAHIIARAKALGASDMLPEDWGKTTPPGELAKPLIESDTDEAFSSNVAAEVKAGKPQDQAVAIAYSVKRKAQRSKAKTAGIELPGFFDDEILDAMAKTALATGKEGLAKAMSAAHKDRIQAIHDHAMNMGASCGDGEKAVSSELKKRDDQLKDALARIKKLEDQPVPHVVLRAVARATPMEKTGDEPIPDLPPLDKADYILNADGTVDWATSYLMKRHKLAAAAARA